MELCDRAAVFSGYVNLPLCLAGQFAIDVVQHHAEELDRLAPCLSIRLQISERGFSVVREGECVSLHRPLIPRSPPRCNHMGLRLVVLQSAVAGPTAAEGHLVRVTGPSTYAAMLPELS